MVDNTGPRFSLKDNSKSIHVYKENSQSFPILHPGARCPTFYILAVVVEVSEDHNRRHSLPILPGPGPVGCVSLTGDTGTTPNPADPTIWFSLHPSTSRPGNVLHTSTLRVLGVGGGVWHVTNDDTCGILTCFYQFFPLCFSFPQGSFFKSAESHYSGVC